MEARQVLEQIKKRYKPQLKPKPKNELIEIICTLSMEVAGLKHELELLKPKEESKEELKNEPKEVVNA